MVILLWPLIFKAIRKVLPAKAAAVVEEISEKPALAVAEHHHVEVTQIDEAPRTENRRHRSDHRRRLHPHPARPSRPGGGSRRCRGTQPARHRRQLLPRRRIGRPRLRHAGRPRLGRTTLEEAGVEFSIRQSVRGAKPPEEVVTVLEEVGGRAVRHRDPTPHGGRQEMLMEASTHRILMDAPCPVLAVKAADHV